MKDTAIVVRTPQLAIHGNRNAGSIIHFVSLGKPLNDSIKYKLIVITCELQTHVEKEWVKDFIKHSLEENGSVLGLPEDMELKPQDVLIEGASAISTQTTEQTAKVDEAIEKSLDEAVKVAKEPSKPEDPQAKKMARRKSKKATKASKKK